MADVVAQPTVELTGSMAGLDKVLNAAMRRLEDYARKVDQVGQKVQGSFTSMTSTIERRCNSIDAVVDKAADAVDSMAAKVKVSATNAATAIDDIAVSSGVASRGLRQVGTEMGAFAIQSRNVAGAARSTGTAVEGMGQRANAAASALASSANRAYVAVTRLTNAANRARAAASQPINVGGGARSGASGVHGMMGGYTLLAAGAGILHGEYDLVKQGAEIEDAIRRVMATAGDDRPYEEIRKEVLSVAEAFDQLPKEVADNLYTVESAGFKGAEGLKVLSASAAMARGTQTPLKDTTDLVTKTLIAYRLGVEKSATVTDIYTKAIKDSLRPGQEFIPALEGVMEVGKSAGLSVEELSAAMAVLTQTTKNANTSATYLKNFMSGLIHPTKQMRDAAKAAGIEWLAMGEGAEHIRKVGLQQTLDEISRATNNNATAFAALFPDMRKNQAILSLLNDGGVRFNKTLADMSQAQGSVAQANKVMDGNFQQMVRHNQIGMQVLASNVETSVKPVMTSLGKILGTIIDDFNALPQPIQSTISIAVALIGTVTALTGAIKILRSAFIAMGLAESGAATAGLAAFGPGAALVIAIAALATELGALITLWGEVRDAEDQAARSAQSYADAQKRISAEGERGANIVNRQKIAQEESDLKDALAQAKSRFNPGFTADARQSNRDAYVRQYLQGLGYDVSNGNYRTEYGANSRLSALEASASQIDTRLREMAKTGAGAAHQSRMRSGEPAYLASMLDRVGERAGTHTEMKIDKRTGREFAVTVADQCGDAISKALRGAGIDSTVSAMLAQARKNPSMQVHPDANGNYPEGTIIYFPKGGKSRKQHFAVAFNGNMAAENTTAGGGGYHYRADRTIKQIAAEHGGQVFAFLPAHAGGLRAVLPQGADNTPGWAKALLSGGNKTPSLPIPTNVQSMPEGLQSKLDAILGTSDTHDHVKALDAAHKAYEADIESITKWYEAMEKAGKPVDDHERKIRELHATLKLLNAEIDANLAQQAKDTQVVAAGTPLVKALRDEYEHLQKVALEAQSHQKAFLQANPKPGVWTPADKQKYHEWQNEIRETNARMHDLLSGIHDGGKGLEYWADHVTRATRELSALSTRQAELKKQVLDTTAAIQGQRQSQVIHQADLLSEQFARGHGSISRADYIAGLKALAATAGLTADAVAELQARIDKLTNTPAGILDEARKYADSGVPKSDFQGRIDAVNTEADARIKAINDSKLIDAKERANAIVEIEKGRADRIAIINTEAYRASQQQALENQKFLLDIGKETLDQYQSDLKTMLDQMVAEFSAAGYADQNLAKDIETLGVQLAQSNWQSMTDEVTSLREAMDDGDISTQQYIADLERMKAVLNAPDTKEGQAIQKAIDQQYRAIDKAHDAQIQKAADSIGSQGADILMGVIHHTDNLRDALRKAATQALDDAFKAAAKNFISGQAKSILEKLHPGSTRTDADKLADVQGKFSTFVDTWKSGVDQLNSVMDRFQSIVNQFSAAMKSPVVPPSGGSVSGGSGTSRTAGAANSAAGKAADAVNAANDVKALVAGPKSPINAAVDAVNAMKSVSSIAKIGSATSFMRTLSTVGSVLGVVGAVAGLAGLLGGDKQAAPTWMGAVNAHDVLTNFGSTIDTSRLSGASGLRMLLGQEGEAQAGVHGNMQPTNVTHHYDFTGLTINAQPGQDGRTLANQFVQTVQNTLAVHTALDNASRGNA